MLSILKHRENKPDILQEIVEEAGDLIRDYRVIIGKIFDTPLPHEGHQVQIAGDFVT